MLAKAVDQPALMYRYTAFASKPAPTRELCFGIKICMPFARTQ
jgi:hypothetical protein